MSVYRWCIWCHTVLWWLVWGEIVNMWNSWGIALLVLLHIVWLIVVDTEVGNPHTLGCVFEVNLGYSMRAFLQNKWTFNKTSMFPYLQTTLLGWDMAQWESGCMYKAHGPIHSTVKLDKWEAWLIWWKLVTVVDGLDVFITSDAGIAQGPSVADSAVM